MKGLVLKSSMQWKWCFLPSGCDIRRATLKFSNIEKLLLGKFFNLLGLKNKGTGAFDQLAVIF